MQYMFNRKWGAAIRIPYMARQIKASEIDQNSGAEISKTTRLNSLGDIRINGIYSGFSDNMASGIIFGLKLPTGQNNAKSIAERNMQIGTGSTDSILGFYHRKKIASGNFDYFMQSSWDHPFMTSHNYRPGDEISAATGIYYSAGSVGKIKNVAPILQFTGSKKLRDKGMESDSLNSGYTQVFFAPGIEITVNQFRIYADVEFPIYHYVNGNQLVPRNLYKLILSYGF
jgi:hypothetical protein